MVPMGTYKKDKKTVPTTATGWNSTSSCPKTNEYIEDDINKLRLQEGKEKIIS